ncbi:cell division protein ZapE [Parafrigoribacterium mesophilum]|uniref:cell division protein ZapE n=1 Tax=Parafrigoribacterium mesophilum TaxID=433646 RepID=UPI0031FD1E42
MPDTAISETNARSHDVIAEHPRSIGSLLERNPKLSGPEMVKHLVPPRQFEHATFESYRPDDDYPSQAEAVESMKAFAGALKPARGGLFRKRAPETLPGIYLDGGFGVGKTHLLAALWHVATGRKYFGTFIEYTALVGALGYRTAVKLLTGASLLCIDEFELDDPGDTRLMSRLLSELVASGSRIAATSNTPPNALGEGRFAAQDFLREIDALSAQFQTIKIDGVDYRRRAIEGHTVSLSPEEFDEAIAGVSGTITVDSFDDILEHLSNVHPSRYVKLVEGLDAIGVRDVHKLASQTDALRLVAFVDRLYDAQIHVFAEGEPLDSVFAEDMLAGGYRKKYLRATSRMISLTTDDIA